jgi:predicted butyrate kinase (DUF1464 family)
MPRVIGIDPGTVSIDLCGIEDGRLWLDQAFPTPEALHQPERLLEVLRGDRPPDLIAGPSGYGLPLVRAEQATDRDLKLAFLAADGEQGGIGGLRHLARLLGGSGLPVVYTPGVIHLNTVPPHRKLNRVDLGTADKLAVAALAIWDQARRRHHPPSEASFILLELGGAFTAALAVERGAIVDGVGGTSGPLGWQSGGMWDGEVAFLAGSVSKELLFRGGRMDAGVDGLAAYIESAHRTVLALTTAVPRPEEILLSGRHARDVEVRGPLADRLSRIAPVVDVEGFAQVVKQGAQGAALIADGLAGGQHQGLVEAMRILDARGTVLDYLRVITPDAARRRIGAE